MPKPKTPIISLPTIGSPPPHALDLSAWGMNRQSNLTSNSHKTTLNQPKQVEAVTKKTSNSSAASLPSRVLAPSLSPLTQNTPGQGSSKNVSAVSSLVQNLKGVAAVLARVRAVKDKATPTALTNGNAGNGKAQIITKTVSKSAGLVPLCERVTRQSVSVSGNLEPFPTPQATYLQNTRNFTRTAIATEYISALTAKTPGTLLGQTRVQSPSGFTSLSHSSASPTVAGSISRNDHMSFNQQVKNGGSEISVSKSSGTKPNNVPPVEDLLTSYFPKAKSSVSASSIPTAVSWISGGTGSKTFQKLATDKTTSKISPTMYTSTPATISRLATSTDGSSRATSQSHTLRQPNRDMNESNSTSMVVLASLTTLAPPNPSPTDSSSSLTSESVRPQGSIPLRGSTEPSLTPRRDPARESLIATILTLTREIQNAPAFNANDSPRAPSDRYRTSYRDPNVSNTAYMHTPTIPLSIHNNNPGRLNSGGGSSRSRPNVVHNVDSYYGSFGTHSPTKLSQVGQSTQHFVRVRENGIIHPHGSRPSKRDFGSEYLRMGLGENLQYPQKSQLRTHINNFQSQNSLQAPQSNGFSKSPNQNQDYSLMLEKILSSMYDPQKLPQLTTTTTTVSPTTSPHPYRDLFLDYYRDKHFAHISSYTVPDYAAGQSSTLKSPANTAPRTSANSSQKLSSASKLKASPARLSSLLGDLATKLAKNAAQQQPKVQPVTGGNFAASSGSSSPVAPRSLSTSSSQPANSKPSEFAGLLDLTPQQQAQFNAGRWGGVAAVPGAAVGASSRGSIASNSGFNGGAAGGSNQHWGGVGGIASQGSSPSGQPQGQGSAQQSSSGSGVDLSWPSGQPIPTVPMSTSGVAPARKATSPAQENQWVQQPPPTGSGLLSPSLQQQQQQQLPQQQVTQQQQLMLQDWSMQPTTQQQQNQQARYQGPSLQQMPLLQQGPPPQQNPLFQQGPPPQQNPPFQQGPPPQQSPPVQQGPPPQQGLPLPQGPPQDQLLASLQFQPIQQNLKDPMQPPQNPPPYDLSMPPTSPNQPPPQPPLSNSPNTQHEFVPPLDLSKLGSPALSQGEVPQQIMSGQERIPQLALGKAWEQSTGGGGPPIIEQSTAIPPLDISGGKKSISWLDLFNPIPSLPPNIASHATDSFLNPCL